MAKFKHHKYTYTNRFGYPQHRWELVGPEGGIHFHVTMVKDFEPSCGLEFHHSAISGYRKGEAPDHKDCPLIGGNCWHTGTSLYASEIVWPLLKNYLFGGDHDSAFRLLEQEYDQHFERIKRDA
jgi:hypothetical protein